MMKIMLWVAAVISALTAGVSIAFATTASVSGQSVTAGIGSVSVCDPAPAWSYAFAKNSNGQVNSVEITNIDVTCAGGSMQVTLAGPVLSSTGTPTPISSCVATCAVTVPFIVDLLYPSQITAANALIVGP